MLQALKTAHDVTFSAYFLWGGRVKTALEDAAKRGAVVHVRLEGFEGKQGALEIDNRNVVQELKTYRIDARLVHQTKASRPALHMKAAVCDGVAFLDDCNWRTSDDTVIRDDSPVDVLAIKHAALHEPRERKATISLDKAGALSVERNLLGRAARGDRVDVETETISYHSDIYSSLKRLVTKGVHCRLLANYRLSDEKERRALELLAAAGVRVRTTRFTEKLAVENAAKAWIGSANATSTHYNGDCIDWGLKTDDAQLVWTVQARFNAHWRLARPFRVSSNG